MSWVLIYWIITASNSMTGSTGFNDQTSCQAALAQLVQEWQQPMSSATSQSFGVAGGFCSSTGTAATTSGTSGETISPVTGLPIPG